MKIWVEYRVRATRNRIRKFRAGVPWRSFLGVFWALMAFEVLKLFAAPLLGL